MSVPVPATVDVHTPRSSLAIIHSLKDEALQQLCDKLSRKARVEFHNKRVGAGWIKYFWNDTIWNLDDDSDYTIFVWRQESASASPRPGGTGGTATRPTQCTLYVHDPSGTLPEPPAYQNPSFYLFRHTRAISPSVHSDSNTRGSPRHNHAHTRGAGRDRGEDGGVVAVAKHRKDFVEFHNGNGVRTVLGSIGPVDNVRMLLRKGHRHVYMSRRFALKHGFVPADAAPGHYGYGGLISLGKWPITLSALRTGRAAAGSPGQERRGEGQGEAVLQPCLSKTVSVPVYLSEEPHFDVVLGRSFFDCRRIKTSALDPTEVTCLDTGERLECELVVLKDGRGDVIIVT